MTTMVTNTAVNYKDLPKELPLCPHKDFCGGCTYQGISYDEQLKIKSDDVKKLLENRNINPKVMEEIMPSPMQFHYRNKMEYTFGDMVKDGEMTLGMHKKGFHMSIITVDQCQLVHPDYNTVLRAVLDWAKNMGYEKYNKKTHKGLLRHLIIRSGIRTGEMLINIVASSQGEFDENQFVSMIENLDLEHNVVGILRTLNDDRADAVKKDELKILKGRDYYVEKLMGLDFKVSIFSFFQTNIWAIEALYEKAISLIDNFDNKTVFDLFCGTGTITQAVAREAKESIGVEIVADAVSSAEKNAELNNLTNCKFLCGDVFDVLDKVDEKPDVIIVDPPRMGIEVKSLDKILAYNVDEIVYISCNPKTLVDNLYYMDYYGYKVKYLRAFDNFPNTKHVETVCLLSREEK